MKLMNIEPIAATFELDPMDLLALADACRYGIRHDIPDDHHLLAALGAAFASAAMAAFALDHGAVEAEEYTLAGLRAFWAPRDTSRVTPRVLEPQ